MTFCKFNILIGNSTVFGRSQRVETDELNRFPDFAFEKRYFSVMNFLPNLYLLS